VLLHGQALTRCGGPHRSHPLCTGFTLESLHRYLVSHLTWYRELDPVAFGEVVRQKRVLDGRNALSRTTWEAAGWSYRALCRRAG
jgi:hypothetical protein